MVPFSYMLVIGRYHIRFPGLNKSLNNGVNNVFVTVVSQIKTKCGSISSKANFYLGLYSLNATFGESKYTEYAGGVRGRGRYVHLFSDGNY